MSDQEENLEEGQTDINEFLKPFVRRYTEKLVAQMEKNELIKGNSSTKRAWEIEYEFSEEQLEIVSADNIPSSNDVELEYLFDFASLIQVVANDLKIQGRSSSDRLNSLISSSVFSNLKEMNRSLETFINKGHLIRNDNTIKSDAIEFIKKSRIDFSTLIHELLVYHAFVKTNEIINKVFYDRLSNSNESFDLYAKNKLENLPDLLIEIKFRKNIDYTPEILSNAISTLLEFNNRTGKSNVMLIVIYTHEHADFDKTKYFLTKNLEENFPEFTDYIFIVGISTPNIINFKNEMNEIFQQIKPMNESFFYKAPKTISQSETYKIPATFLKYPYGSISAWIKVPALAEILSKPMNNMYLIGHDTNMGDHPRVDNRHIYRNGFGLCLTPNKFSNNINRGDNPTSVYWRLWISNDIGQTYDMDYPSWNQTETAWHHFFIRWDNQKQFIELYFNGNLVAHNDNDYIKFWPKTLNEYAMLGNWVSPNEIFCLNMPIYRLIITPNNLNDAWIKNEIDINKPDS